MSSKKENTLKFTSSARYRICVKGFLDDSWSDRFGNMNISNQSDTDISPLVILEGTVIDQSELIGLLNSFYQMHMPIVSISFVDD